MELMGYMRNLAHQSASAQNAAPPEVRAREGVNLTYNVKLLFSFLKEDSVAVLLGFSLL